MEVKSTTFDHVQNRNPIFLSLQERLLRIRSLAPVTAMFIVSGVFGATVALGQTIPGSPISVPSPTATTMPVVVPKGTMFVVATRRSYKSYGASTGTKVTYDLVQDIIVNGYVVAKTGDAAQGEILNAHEGKAAGFFTSAEGANLRLSVDKIFNFCGDTIETDFARSEYRRRQGAFGGKVDLEISKGQQYAVPSERVQKVCGEKTDAQPLPVPDSALMGDKD